MLLLVLGITYIGDLIAVVLLSPCIDYLTVCFILLRFHCVLTPYLILEVLLSLCIDCIAVYFIASRFHCVLTPHLPLLGPQRGTHRPGKGGACAGPCGGDGRK